MVKNQEGLGRLWRSNWIFSWIFSWLLHFFHVFFKSVAELQLAASIPIFVIGIHIGFHLDAIRQDQAAALLKRNLHVFGLGRGYIVP